MPPLGEKRFVTYTELKTRVERDREAGTRTVGAIHAAMLKQIPTLSLKKVQAIQQAYPTPKALYGTYVGLTPEDGKTLVQDFCTNTGMERTCRVGPKSAAEVYYTYTETISTTTQGEEEGSSNGVTSTGLSQESTTSTDDAEGFARMPSQAVAAMPAANDSFSPTYQAFSSSPQWSPESDAKWPAYDSPPRKKPASSIYKSSPTSPVDEMRLALQRRRAQYEASQKQKPMEMNAPSQDDGFVDLTQGYESDAEESAGLSQSSSNVGFSIVARYSNVFSRKHRCGGQKSPYMFECSVFIKHDKPLNHENDEGNRRVMKPEFLPTRRSQRIKQK